ncbi:Rap1a/Tai family immunity protein [Novosphingobium sp. BL-8H]|uniref:Rap1a/Tai family immunity protein n=1 Tax=Novosphingobium sp. BL-8H TaxID=3127640 RepID=UPI00375781CB
MNSAKLACIAVAAPLVLLPVAADAGFYTGNDLYEICTVQKGEKEYLERSYECIAYITGAVDALNTTREAAKLKSCIPAGVTISQLKDVTVGYLRDNPETRNDAASSLVFAATRKAWSCPPASAPKPPAKPTVKKKR